MRTRRARAPSPSSETRCVTSCGPDVDCGNALAPEDLSTPAADVALAVGRLLASDPSDSERATAELLNYIAATWDKQDLPLREHAQAVARTLRTQ